MDTIRPDFLSRFPLQFYLNLCALEKKEVKNILNKKYDEAEGGNMLHLLCLLTGDLKFTGNYYFFGQESKINQGLAILIAQEMKYKGVDYKALNFAYQTPLQMLKNPEYPLERRRKNNDIYIDAMEVLSYF